MMDIRDIHNTKEQRHQLTLGDVIRKWNQIMLPRTLSDMVLDIQTTSQGLAKELFAEDEDIQDLIDGYLPLRELEVLWSKRKQDDR